MSVVTVVSPTVQEYAGRRYYLCGRNLDGPAAPYPGMATAFEAHTGQSWTDPDWRAETSIWAAAWKAALLHNAKVSACTAGCGRT